VSVDLDSLLHEMTPLELIEYLRNGPGKDAPFDDRFAWMEARRAAGFKQVYGMGEVDVEWELRTRLRVDLPGLIRANRLAYHTPSLEELECDEEWQRPEGWLIAVLSEDVGPDFTHLNTAFRYIKGLDDAVVNMRWSQKDYLELIELCPEARRLPDGSSPVTPQPIGSAPLPFP